MRGATLDKPGSKDGPCKEECQHRYCKILRQYASKICRICGKPIGYDTKFHTDNKNPDEVVHARCLWEEVEREQKSKQMPEKEMSWIIQEIKSSSLPPWSIGYIKNGVFVAVAYCFEYPDADFVWDAFDAQGTPEGLEMWNAKLIE